VAWSGIGSRGESADLSCAFGVQVEEHQRAEPGLSDRVTVANRGDL
jgi:hypothetical protein